MFPSPAARCSSAPVQACVLLIVLLRLNQTVYVCMCVCAHVCVCRLCVHITRLIRPHEPHEPVAGMHIKVGKTLNLHSPNKCHPPPRHSRARRMPGCARIPPLSPLVPPPSYNPSQPSSAKVKPFLFKGVSVNIRRFKLWVGI